MRQSNSMGSETEMPQRKLETVKMVMHKRKKRLRPITLDAHAPMGRTMAFDTK
jgi:hypothetical protein